MVEQKEAKALTAKMFKDANKSAKGASIGMEKEAFLLTPEDAFNILLAFTSIKQFQALPVMKARLELIKNKAMIVAYLRELLEQNKAVQEKITHAES